MDDFLQTFGKHFHHYKIIQDTLMSEPTLYIKGTRCSNTTSDHMGAAHLKDVDEG